MMTMQPLRRARPFPREFVCRVGLVVGGLVVAAAGGCAAGQRAMNQAPVPTTGSAELVLYITDQALITAEPAYRAVYALANGASFDGDYAALRDQMADERLIEAHWHHAPDEYLDRATIAYLVARACRLQTGVNWQLTGLGRYAWRELQYQGIAGGGSEYGVMTGGEFAGLLLKAEEYLAQHMPTGAPQLDRPTP